MTETTKMRVAVVLYRMYDTLICKNTDECFIADFDDFMSARDNEYVKKYLRNQHCLLYKVRESHFIDGISAVWKVDTGVFKSLYRQYNEYIKDYDTYQETLTKLRNKAIKTEKEVIEHKKHLSEAPKLFTSKHRRKYYINNVNEVYDIAKERYTFWDDIQNKIKYINERNVDLPRIHFDINITHSKGIVSKVSCRYSNSLVAMKAHETDDNGYTERQLYCKMKGLNYEFDVNASIHRLTYMFNHNGESIDGDVYEQIFRVAFPDKKWDSEARRLFKKFMMRNYFDTSAKNAAKNFINSEKKEGRKHDEEFVYRGFELIYPALREVEGQTFDNEIFFWESVTMINLIYEIMQKYPDLKVFSVYDGIYFNKPIEAEVAAVWQLEAEKTCALLLASTETSRVQSSSSNSNISSRTCISSNSITVSSKAANSTTLYTLTDKLKFQDSLANNNAQVCLLDFATKHCKLGLYDIGSSIEMIESRRSNAAKGKGVKHNSSNMKGVKHNSSNMKGVKHDKKTGVITKISTLGLNNITDMKLFVAECEKLGIKRRTAYSWFKLLNN